MLFSGRRCVLLKQVTVGGVVMWENAGPEHRRGQELSQWQRPGWCWWQLTKQVLSRFIIRVLGFSTEGAERGMESGFSRNL